MLGHIYQYLPRVSFLLKEICFDVEHLLFHTHNHLSSFALLLGSYFPLNNPAIGNSKRKMPTHGEGDGGENVTAFLGGPRFKS